MSLRIAVVTEHAEDFEIATELADRVFCDALKQSLDEEWIPYQRVWLNTLPSGHPLTWTNIKRSALEADVRPHGRFNGESAEPDARAARRAILYLRQSYPDLAGVLLIRDQDDQPLRLKGINQARDREPQNLAIVIGLAIVERESWVLSGYNPLSEAEESLLQSEISRVSLDPRTHSHRLDDHKSLTAQLSPKRALTALTGNNFERERQCWRTTPLATLRQRGTENGLTAYLDEVRTKLALLIGHIPPRQ